MTEPMCSTTSYQLHTVALNGFGMLALCTIGLFGNTICLAVWIRTYLGTVTFSHYLSALCVADTITLVSCLFMLVIPILTSFFGVNEDVQAAVNHFIITFYPIGTVAENASTLIVTVISVVRYLAVFYPIKMNSSADVRFARGTIAVVVTFSFLFNIPRMFELTISPCSSLTNGTLLMVDVTSLRSSYSFNVYYMILTNGIVMFLMPFCVVLYCNCAVACKNLSTADLVLKGESHRRRDVRCKTDMTARLLILICLFFLASQVMPLVINILDGSSLLFGVTLVSAETFSLFVDVSNFLVFLKASSNFFFYMMFNRRFRQFVLQRHVE